MEQVYLDNAATTPVLDAVIDAMMSSMKENYGNPSSTHQIGRTAKTLLENSRKSIAKLIGASSNEIIFTSGGTEANNLIIHNAIVNLEVELIVTSELEHHAVLKTVKELGKLHSIEVVYVDVDANGVVDFVSLREILASTGKKALVSLMFVNNEIGRILDVQKTGVICKEYGALFHSDAVQAVGHFDLDLDALGIDFISAAAHKFHGPKGTGFAYFKRGYGVKSMLYGGSQEKGARAGTEALHNIVGMALALELSIQDMDDDIKQIARIKRKCIAQLKKEIPEVAFNACSDVIKTATVTVLSIRLPKDFPFILFSLDMKGISVSGGSACQSGSDAGSHVLSAILNSSEAAKTSLRVSFSKFTTEADIEYFVKSLKEIIEG